MKLPILVGSVFACLNAHSRIGVPHDINVYRGTLGKARIEIVVNVVSLDSQALDGVYMYTKYHEPIPLEGSHFRSKLELSEAGGHRFVFEGFGDSAQDISGTWTHAGTKKVLPVVLRRQDDNVGVLQKQSLKKFFFRVSKNSGEFFQNVEVHEKKSGREIGQVTGTHRYDMGVVAIDQQDQRGRTFLIVRAYSGDVLYGYRIDGAGRILRTCCENSSEDSLDLLYPNRHKE